MIDRQIILYEYEKVLLGQKKTFSNVFVGTEENKRETVGIIWNYAITHLLGWSPKDAKYYLTPEIIEQLHLDVALKFIDYNYSKKKTKDYTYILSIAFPNEIMFDIKEHCIDEYEHVLKKGAYKNEKEPYQFTKNFFEGNEIGIRRASIVLNYAVSTFLNYMSLEELYDFFADSTQAMRFLKEKKIATNAKILYESPLDYMHYSLPDGVRNEFLYNYHLFKKEYEKKKNAK